jgi:periplasmic divalent cation tolerance protein
MSVDITDSAILVFTTLGDVDDAQALVRRLVSSHLVACGTVIPSVRSVYMWEGKLQDESEALVLLKTRRELWDELEKTVRDLHPYDVPEILALRVETGLPEYMSWLMGQTGDEAT